MTRPRQLALALAVSAAAVAASCGGDDSDELAAQHRRRTAGEKMRIAAPEGGGTLKGNVVELDMAGVAPVRIVDADGDTSARTGHYHVFVDQEPVPLGQVIPKAPGIVHTSEAPIQLTGLTIGRHRFAVVLGDGAHRRIGTNVARTELVVEGPSVRASAPATIKEGEVLAVAVTAEGVALAPANGDTSRATGHVDVFVDRAPTPAGDPVPVERGIVHGNDAVVAVSGLSRGPHVIWVVLVDGTHGPFDPRVAHKIEVEVE